MSSFRDICCWLHSRKGADVEVIRRDATTVGLRDLDLFSCELLHQISESADPSGSESATNRIFSSPTGGAEPEFDREWAEYVGPDLKHCFESSLATVKGDLESLKASSEDDAYQVDIPMSHLEAWIHALNQARLVLAARYDFGEKEMERMPLTGDMRALALYQIHFSGCLQERFLHELAE